MRLPMETGCSSPIFPSVTTGRYSPTGAQESRITCFWLGVAGTIIPRDTAQRLQTLAMNTTASVSWIL